MRTCTVPECERKHYGKGLCHMHYQRMRRTGRLQRPGRIERFWTHVRKSDGCWEWTGSTNKGGYGTFGWHDSKRGGDLAHRVSFFIEHGHWPEPYCLHKCDNPPCVRPDHLYEGDQFDNMEDWKERTLGDTCHRGHEWTPENTYVRKNGTRYCRQCAADRQRENYHARKTNN